MSGGRSNGYGTYRSPGITDEYGQPKVPSGPMMSQPGFNMYDRPPMFNMYGRSPIARPGFPVGQLPQRPMPSPIERKPVGMPEEQFTGNLMNSQINTNDLLGRLLSRFIGYESW